jgi:hypothetical protein
MVDVSSNVSFTPADLISLLAEALGLWLATEILFFAES